MKFKIMNQTGDGEFNYTDLKTAELKFDELINSNLLPVVVSPEGKKRALQKFELAADEIIWMPKIAGG